jgi:hypothetical protein
MEHHHIIVCAVAQELETSVGAVLASFMEDNLVQSHFF